MSFLAPLYVLGALGIGLPILFHLIRRQPKSTRSFSSLMFMTPSPPAVTKKSRLEQWPLLLIRALALIAIAAAFARPFVRSTAFVPPEQPTRTVFMLIDTSASMRRDGLWEQMQRAASDVIASLEPSDRVAIATFDDVMSMRLDFDAAPASEGNAKTAATAIIDELKPTWKPGRFAPAMMAAADTMSNLDADEDASNPSKVRTVVVISDMQDSESGLSELQSFAWPKDVSVQWRSLQLALKTNAFATLLNRDDASADDEAAIDKTSPGDERRVRVVNSADSTRSLFDLYWSEVDGTPIASTRISVQVAPGDQRVVSIADPPQNNNDGRMRLVLAGDDQDFDNVRYLARQPRQETQVMIIGESENTPRESLGYYLQLAPLDHAGSAVKVVSAERGRTALALSVRDTPMIVVTAQCEPNWLPILGSYLNEGGRVLWVLDASTDLLASQSQLRTLAQSPEMTIAEADKRDYAMWSRIDFRHPVFRPFDDPLFNDFSKIKFWSHRKVENADGFEAVVRFDDGSLAIAGKPIGKGSVFVMTSGWQPTNSQLALSTKFVPLLIGLLGQSSADDERMDDRWYVGRADLNGTEQPIDAPGFHDVPVEDGVLLAAVNLDPVESRGESMTDEALEQLGFRNIVGVDVQSVLTQRRLQYDVELESSQRVWQWLMVAALGFLAVESIYGGLLNRVTRRPAGE